MPKAFFEVVENNPDKTQTTHAIGSTLREGYDLGCGLVKSKEVSNEDLIVVEIVNRVPTFQWSLDEAYKELTQPAVQQGTVDTTPKPTEGPWRVVVSEEPTDFPFIEIESPTGKNVATVTNNAEPEDACNAQLVAQAPNMLFLLGELAMYYNSKTRTEVEENIMNSVIQIVDKIGGNIPDMGELDPTARNAVLNLMDANTLMLDFLKGLLQGQQIPPNLMDSLMEILGKANEVRTEVTNLL